MTLLFSWFRNILAFEDGPIQSSYSVVDPTSAKGDSLSTIILAVDPSPDGRIPTIVSLRFEGSEIKLFEKKYDNDQDAQTQAQTITNDLQEVSTLAKEGKIDESKNLMASLIEKYKRYSDNLSQPSVTPTMTQASQTVPIQYKGFSIEKIDDQKWNVSQGHINFYAMTLNSAKSIIDGMIQKAANKQIKKNAGVVVQNLFYDTVDEFMDAQKKTQELQGGPAADEGTPLWEQMQNQKEEPLAEGNEPGEEQDELAPSNLVPDFKQVEKDKAKQDKDIGKRIKEQVKTEVESALEQKSASVFGKDDEELVKALRLPNIGRNWDEIKKYFVKELSRNEDDTAVFLDGIRMKEEGGEPEGLPMPPKPPEDLVSPETHDKLVKEVDEKKEPENNFMTKEKLMSHAPKEPKPLEDEIARADNSEIRKVAHANPGECPVCRRQRDMQDIGHGKMKCGWCGTVSDKKDLTGGPRAPEGHFYASKKVALNPLQEPPAIGDAPGQPLASPVEEAPTMDAPVAPPETAEPELLEQPQQGDRVYVMGDYETGNDGFEGTMVSTYTSKGDEYAVIAKDDGANEEVAMHRVVKAAQKKVAKAYYEKIAGPVYCSVEGCERQAHDTVDGKRYCPKHLKHYSQPDVTEKKEADLEVDGKGNEDVILMFVNDSFPKDKMPTWGTTNLKITKYPNGWALVNYQTPILYRPNNSNIVYFNTGKYSVTTSKIQNQIRNSFSGQDVKETDEAGIQAEMSEPVYAQPELGLKDIHEAALKLQAELEHIDEIAFYFTKEGIEKKASDDSAFEGNGWCRVWVQADEIATNPKYADVLKLPDENARILALHSIAREIAHEALRGADQAAGKFGVQAWFESLSPSDHDRINWVALANPKDEEAEDKAFWDKWDAEHPQAKSSQNPKIEKKAFDFSMNQDLKIGDKVEVIGKIGTIYKIDRVQDVYHSEEEFNAFQEVYGNKGLSWAGNEIMTVMVDLDGVGYEAFAYQVEKVLPTEASKKQAAGPEEVPTKFKELKISPKDIDKEKALPATNEQAELVKSIELSLNNLTQIKSFIDQAKAKFDQEVAQIRQSGGQVAVEADLKDKIEKLAKLLEATESKLIYQGDKYITLQQGTKEVPFKPTPQWQLEKVLEKFEGAKEYLAKAAQGAQNLATKESIRDLVFWPKKMSKLDRKAGLMETLSEVYDDVLNALKNIISEPEPEKV